MALASGSFLNQRLNQLINELAPLLHPGEMGVMIAALERVPPRGVARADVLFRFLGSLGSTWVFADPEQNSPGIVSTDLAAQYGILNVSTVWLREETIVALVEKLREQTRRVML